ncbi:MAG: translocation/assembly module TamB [Sphingomonas sp.]|uniref:translocation/assembly module TamB domain-containing protein n=1 Tax=Sphingomonas sp. TaxID=28214 RepID=UPI00121B28D5|nr:translocation/assembly module TamB domain-containing protein [Sphingomonas sp.]THD36987.1 MAG: translocation/assembly module TamB [Sphingomonas sp.]
MAEAAASDATPEKVVIVRRPLWQSITRWFAIVLLGIAALLALVYVGLDTAPGHRFIVSRLAAYTTETGLNIKVGRIKGSIYGRMELVDLRVSDTRNVFLTAPSVVIEWHPFQFLWNHVDVDSMEAPLVTMTRPVVLKPGDPNAPILPDIDVDIGRLKVDRLVLAKEVTGQAHLVRLDGSAHIAAGRAQLVANADALKGPGIAGGDKLRLTLDAVPKDNRLTIKASLDAPGDGVAAAMSGIKAPLSVRIGGNGDWKAWRGKGQATLGGQSLADLDLGAANGTFTIHGLTHPGLYMAGPVERLTAGGMMVDISSTLDKRKATTRMTLTSSALAVAANGLLDLGENKFGNFTVDARLLTPGAILPNLAGRDVMAHLTLDGPFATPTLGYSISAAVLSFNGTGVEGLTASGKATVDADHVLVPVDAHARRVTGLNAMAGGLLTNVSAVGDFAYSKGKLLSDNLRIKSDRIDATAIVVADLPSGHYTGALKGRVNNYLIDGIGIVDLTTDAKLVSVPSGGFGIKGHVVARTRRIFSDGVQNFLGGNALVSSDVGYDPNGLITFNNVKLSAPQFTLYRGAGRYAPNGQLLFAGDGYSKAYGPVSARVTGTADAPLIAIHAPRPGVGVGLTDLEATIRGKGDGYAVVAKGNTNYGAFGANVFIKTGRTLTVQVNQGTTFAGINLLGNLEQTAAGPFAGKLQFAGSGVNGVATLSAEGKAQRADFNAHAYNAKIPGAVDFTIGRALANGTVILYPNGPRILADVQLANLRYGDTVLSVARAKIDYANGAGTVQALANGSSGVPFNMGLSAALQPKLWLVAVQGKANGIAFRTPRPARIEPLDGEYRLQPTQIVFDKGSARVAGSYGKGTNFQARLDNLDLSVANALVPGLNIDGSATGSIDYAQPNGAAVPNIDTRLTITSFTRSSAEIVSRPVDIVFLGRLTAAGGDARALVKRGATTVGRLQANLAPLGSGASWTERLTSAPLSGGVRYNGPAEVLFSLAGLANQQASGGIAVAADFGGRLGAPSLNGIVRADNLTYINSTYGTKLTAMQLTGRFSNDRLDITQLHATAGKGTVDAHGSIGLAADSGFPINLEAQLNNATLADSDALAGSATGTITVTNGKDGGLIKGDLRIPNARYQVVFQGQAEVPALAGVRRKSDVASQHKPPPPPSNFKLDLHIRAPNQVFVSGMGLESEWSLNLRVGGTSAAPTVNGRAEIVRGTYEFAGKRFDIDRGNVRFSGNALSDPDLDISATTDTNGITAVINIAGTGQRPQITFTSTPALPQDEVLSRLLFGTNPENLSAPEALQLAAALNSLRGGGGGLNPLGKLRGALGIDRLRILGADETTGRGTALAAGKYITRNIYIEIITDARGFTATQLEISLSKSLSILSQMSSFGGSGASVKYQKTF